MGIVVFLLCPMCELTSGGVFFFPWSLSTLQHRDHANTVKKRKRLFSQLNCISTPLSALALVIVLNKTSLCIRVCVCVRRLPASVVLSNW